MNKSYFVVSDSDETRIAILEQKTDGTDSIGQDAKEIVYFNSIKFKKVSKYEAVAISNDYSNIPIVAAFNFNTFLQIKGIAPY